MSDEQNNENNGEGFKKLSEFEASQNQGSTENQQNENDEGESDLQMPDELTLLKQRARLMGVQFSNNIGLDSLKARIKEHQEKSNQSSDAGTGEAEEDEGDVAEATPAPKKKTATAADVRRAVQEENMKLIRLRITNLDPKKANLPGEIFTVANEYLGTVRKYVPFGEQTDNGYHVPYCIYKQLRNRKFLSIKVTKRNGRETVTSQWVKEFALDILPPLTEGEIAKLAASQSAAGGLND